MAIAFVANHLVSFDGLVSDTPTTLTGTDFTPSAGNLLVWQYADAGGGGFAHPVTAVTDNQGNTWVQIPGCAGSAALEQVDIWYANNCAGGNTVLTVTITNGDTNAEMVVTELSGASSTAPLRAGSGAFVNRANSLPTDDELTPLTPTAANQALISFYNCVNLTPSGINPPWTGYVPATVTGALFAYYINPPLSTQTGVLSDNAAQGGTAGAIFQTVAGPSAKQKSSANLVF